MAAAGIRSCEVYIKMAATELNKKLRDDLDGLARRFISIYNLKYTASVSNLACPVMRWLDFRMRYVSPKPRNIVYSNQFSKSFPQDIQDGLDVFVEKIEKGEDINPYQGKGLIEHNDTSGASAAKRTDLLWASWGILHFHLTKNSIPAGGYFSDRSSHQAFCAFDDDTVAIIDIRPHPQGDGYSDPNFLHIIAESWPYALDRAEIKGVLAGAPQTAAEIHQLRKAGVNSVITIKGKNYMNPGVGLTSAGTSLNQQMFHIQLNDAVRILADLIELDPVFKGHVSKAGVDAPNFGLTVIEKGVTLYEEKSGIVFGIDIESLPRLKLLQDALFPDWALKEYAKSSYADNF